MLEKKEYNIPINQNINTVKSIELVRSGDDYFLRLQSIINEAKIEIHLQTYIFENDATGKQITECLKKAALRKVNIYILFDAFGSKYLSKVYTEDLIQHGIQFRFFSTNLFFISRRLHHKVVVADGKIAMIGGINIADKYHGTKTMEPWLDYAAQIEGKIAEPLQQLCKNIYFRKKRYAWKQNIFNSGNDTSLRILQNDWLKRKNEISNSYLKSIGNAKKEVVIIGSYFLPGRKLKNTLKKAALKGVKIKLILSGVSDVPMLRRATCYLYSKLLHYNIELYEWDKSVLHAKAAVVDDQWATIGSFNLNQLSSYGSLEMNVEINSTAFTTNFKSHLNGVIAQCEEITFDTLKTKNGIVSKLINWLSYYLVRTGLIIVTYFPQKRFFKRYHVE